MNKFIPALTIIFLFMASNPAGAQLKSILYDFEGQHIGQTDLPEGDYQQHDMKASVQRNPLGSSPMLGKNCLKLEMNWNSGKALFGKGISRFIEMDASEDYFNFYIYNPTDNPSGSKLEIIITEDDNKNDVWEYDQDDMWNHWLTVNRSSSWQLISIPLNAFKVVNSGGNGTFDAAFTNHAGKIFNIEFLFHKNLPDENSSTVYLDMICFSEGKLPTGSSILDVPSKSPSDYCLLGAFVDNDNPENTPNVIEGFFSQNSAKKIKYVNWFHLFSADGGTRANHLPGQEVSQLLQRGYRPVITWEALYEGYSRLDPVQPRLNDFMRGDFDAYIDDFGDKLKSYNDTIIVRFMHEFEGDWYPWSLVHNGKDPGLYKDVFRKVVNRIKARGASKVLWMWCVNGPTYHPVEAYNWIVGAYPGDSYVDIVACEAYNITIPGVPYWRSFREGMAEPYYYLKKYFPNKVMYICENGCRERYSGEDPTGQSKAEWIAQMDKELQSFFPKVRALLFFSQDKVHDYRINSSSSSLDAVENNIWNDNYYFRNSSVSVPKEKNEAAGINIFPNPASDQLTIELAGNDPVSFVFEFYSMEGKLIRSFDFNGKLSFDLSGFSEGFYSYVIRNDKREVIKRGKAGIVRH